MSFPMASITATTSAVARESPPRLPRVAIERMKTPGSPACSCMRMRSPRIAPPVKVLLGSTATTPTDLPAARQRAMSRPVSDDLPVPGAPVSPTTCAWRPARKSCRRVSRAPGRSSSRSRMSRAAARTSPAATRSAMVCTRSSPEAPSYPSLPIRRGPTPYFRRAREAQPTGGRDAASRLLPGAGKGGAGRLRHPRPQAARSVPVAVPPASRRVAVTGRGPRGRSRVEFRMNTSSDATWMNAARSGFRNPNAASRIPSPSTVSVPPKFCRMMRRHRRAMRMVSTSAHPRRREATAAQSQAVNSGGGEPTTPL